jgi:2-polyprenyl-3-methyl-5-hydroxy-6-metoxy-1,4-benzoquinol methylase
MTKGYRQEVGEGFPRASKVADGWCLKAVYKDHTRTLAEMINKVYYRNIVDLGGGCGALVADLKGMGISGRFTNVEADRELLAMDDSSNLKVCSRIEELPNGPRYDIALMRHVLNYNSLNTQKIIVRKVHNILNQDGLFVLQHCCPVDKEHQRRLKLMTTTPIVSEKLIRADPYWSTWEEVRAILKDSGFETKVAETFEVGVGELFQQRYNLTKEEEARFHELLGEYSSIRYVISGNRKRTNLIGKISRLIRGSPGA